jgi:large subunit ribosomal protein L28
MSRVCELTGKRMMVGNNVSHSKRRTKRKFLPNIVTKRFYIVEEDRWVTLKICTKALKTINKIGVLAAIKRSKEAGIYKG